MKPADQKMSPLLPRRLMPLHDLAFPPSLDYVSQYFLRNHVLAFAEVSAVA